MTWADKSDEEIKADIVALLKLIETPAPHPVRMIMHPMFLYRLTQGDPAAYQLIVTMPVVPAVRLDRDLHEWTVQLEWPNGTVTNHHATDEQGNPR